MPLTMSTRPLIGSFHVLAPVLGKKFFILAKINSINSSTLQPVNVIHGKRKPSEFHQARNVWKNAQSDFLSNTKIDQYNLRKVKLGSRNGTHREFHKRHKVRENVQTDF